MCAKDVDLSLEGDLITVPFASPDYLEEICSEYEQLAAGYGADRILILNRYPSGTQELEDALAESVRSLERPRVRILTEHAERVLEELESPPEVFDRDKRSVLVDEFLATYEWDTPYLRAAATREGFQNDFARFLVSASYQQRPESVQNRALEELYDAVADYHAFCRRELPEQHDLERGFLDRTKLITTAIDLLRDPDIAAQIRADFDAVLALEFEEFDATSRTYLAQLTRDRELVAIAQSDSAVRRPFSEPGRIEQAVPMNPRDDTGVAIADPLQALSSYLGVGDSPPGEMVDLHKMAFHLSADTFRNHIQAVAEEIDRLHRNQQVPYDEIAVVLRDSNAQIAETNDILRAQGLPTSSATVRGLEYDPAARELLAVARWLAAAESDPHTEADRAYDTLVSRLRRSHTDAVAEDTVDTALTAAREAPDIYAGFTRWLVHSGLKERIADGTEPIEARIRFDHVRRLKTLVKFLSDPPIQADWRRVVEEFERQFEAETVDRVSEALDTVEGAVWVDAARTVKTREFRVVFLVGVVEGEYPTDPQFGGLFPSAQLRRFDTYPTVTAPSTADVEETFGTAMIDGDASKDPLDAYYKALSRRMLAIGARAARGGAGPRAVYMCTYEQERGLGRRRRPSRFLLRIEDALGPLGKVPPDGSDNDPETFALTRIEDAVDRIRQGAIRDEPVDLDGIEREFGAVGQILAEADDPTLRRAIEAKIDLARGRVRRD